MDVLRVSETLRARHARSRHAESAILIQNDLSILPLYAAVGRNRVANAEGPSTIEVISVPEVSARQPSLTRDWVRGRDRGDLRAAAADSCRARLAVLDIKAGISHVATRAWPFLQRVRLASKVQARITNVREKI